MQSYWHVTPDMICLKHVLCWTAIFIQTHPLNWTPFHHQDLMKTCWFRWSLAEIHLVKGLELPMKQSWMESQRLLCESWTQCTRKDVDSKDVDQGGLGFHRGTLRISKSLLHFCLIFVLVDGKSFGSIFDEGRDTSTHHFKIPIKSEITQYCILYAANLKAIMIHICFILRSNRVFYYSTTGSTTDGCKHVAILAQVMPPQQFFFF